MIYPLALLLTFPIAKELFWINIIALSFFFFKKGLVRGYPKWAYEKAWISILVVAMLTLEYIYISKIYSSPYG